MTVPAVDQTVAPLTEIDARIEATRRGRLTLDPSRSLATPLNDLVNALAAPSQRPFLTAMASAVALSLIHI